MSGLCPAEITDKDQVVRTSLAAVSTFSRLIHTHVAPDADLAAAEHASRKLKAGYSVNEGFSDRKVARSHLAILAEVDAYLAFSVLWMQHEMLEEFQEQYSGPTLTAQQRLKRLSHHMTINRNSFGKMLHKNSHEREDMSRKVLRKYAGRSGRIIDALVDFRLACEVALSNTKTKWIALAPRGLAIMENVIEAALPSEGSNDFRLPNFNSPEVEDYVKSERA
jgi:hypothetical protein